MEANNEGCIQVEVSYGNCSEPVICPVCQAEVLGVVEDDALDFDPCNHTLFIASDYGFEYRSDKFDRVMGISGIETSELNGEIENIDEYTDLVPLPNAVKFSIYVPAPGSMGMYFGFDPDSC